MTQFDAFKVVQGDRLFPIAGSFLYSFQACSGRGIYEEADVCLPREAAVEFEVSVKFELFGRGSLINK